MKLSDVSVGVIYDLEGSRNDDLVYLQWLDENSFLIRGEIFGVKAMELGSDLRPEVFKEGLVEEGLELVVCNIFNVDKLIKRRNELRT